MVLPSSSLMNYGVLRVSMVLPSSFLELMNHRGWGLSTVLTSSSLKLMNRGGFGIEHMALLFIP